MQLADLQRRTTMKERELGSGKTLQQKSLSRRDIMRGVAGSVLGASVLHSSSVFASSDQQDNRLSECVGVKPIPGGLAPLKPYGIFIHHNPLNPATPLANISDPSQITDFDGFVGLTHIQGGGTGTNTMTGESMTLAFRADMGFSQGKFIGTDEQEHHRTLTFV
jgi:hypothetical protein